VDFEAGLPKVQLIDFGLSVNFSAGENGIYNQRRTVSHWMAPEVYNYTESYNAPRADIFSLGVILFSLVKGSPPFRNSVDCPYYELLQNNPDLFFDKHGIKNKDF
jgi:serine/threonine protein kinase